MKIQDNYITPDEGMWLTREVGGWRVFSDGVWLGKNRSASLWEEWTDEQKVEYETQQALLSKDEEGTEVAGEE